jgi:WASH complex subunit strumpellin
LLEELSQYLETAGINDPYTKIYITTDPVDNLSCLLFLFVVAQASKFQYSDHLSIIMHKKDKRPFDSTPFVVGVITLLKQFHSSVTQRFLSYLGQYIRAFTNISLQRDPKSVDLPEECISVLLYLEQFCKLSNMDLRAIEGNYILYNVNLTFIYLGLVPTYVFDHFKH